MAKLRILFLCRGNSCRSQMAEGWARALKGDEINAYSAGVEAQGLNTHAVMVMQEAGVDIRGQQSKTVDALGEQQFDAVVTVCGANDSQCPTFHGTSRMVHRSFDDPPQLARDAASEEEALGHYRRVRDEIRTFVESLPEGLAVGG